MTMLRSMLLVHARPCIARVFSLLLALVGATAACAQAGELPGDSVYRLDIPLVDQNGTGSHLADRRGRPQLISMFYTSCQYVCPLIIDTLRTTERSLDPAERQDLDVLVVSFDPERDTPVQLKNVFDKRNQLSRGVSCSICTNIHIVPGTPRVIGIRAGMKF